MKNINYKNNLQNLLNGDIFDTYIENKTMTEHYKKIHNILHTETTFFLFDENLNFLHKNNISIEEIKVFIKTFKKDNKNNIDYENICNPYKLEKIVLSGGGAKGIIYIGVLLGLYNTGQIFYLNNFIGSSVGALFSMILSCITPNKDIYDTISKETIKNNFDSEINKKYKEAIKYCSNRLYNRNIESFYQQPTYTFFGIINTVSSLINYNSIYDAENTGFSVWYALICKKICQIMDNKLDELIIIKNKITNEIIIDIKDDFIDNDILTNLIIDKFFTFEEYNKITNKIITITGTQTKNTSTVYYTHTNEDFKNLSVLLCATASMSIPWIFKAPIINECYHFDGGLYNNYPLTYYDIKDNNEKILSYDNTVFGFLIDDNSYSNKNVNDIIITLWFVYNNFSKITSIENIKESVNFIEISELFFEIRNTIGNILFSPKSLIINFLHNFNDDYNINNIIDDNKEYIINLLSKLLEYDKLNLDKVYEYSLTHSYIYQELSNFIMNEKNSNDNYIKTLNYISDNILIFYELKNNLLSSEKVNKYSVKFMKILENLKEKLNKFDILYKKELNNIINLYDINNIILLLDTIINYILGNKIKNNIEKNNGFSYQNIINYYCQTDMTNILCKYFTIANDKITNDNFNYMRTIKLNTFEIGTIDFKINDELKTRLIYEGYTKTIQHLSNILEIMSISNKTKTELYIDTYETKIKKLFG